MAPRSFRSWAERAGQDNGEGSSTSSSNPFAFLDVDVEEQEQIEALIAAENAETSPADEEGFDEKDTERAITESLDVLRVGEDDAATDAEGALVVEQDNQAYEGKGKGKAKAQDCPANGDDWEVAGLRQKQECQRLGIQRATRRKEAIEAAKRREEERIRRKEEHIRREREYEEAEARQKEARAEQLAKERRKRQEQRQEQKDLLADIKYQQFKERYGKGMDEMVKWFKIVMDGEMSDEELPTIVVEDTERANNYVDEEKESAVTEVGFAIVPLYHVRKHMRAGASFLEAWCASTVTRHLRITEHGRCQLIRPDKRGERLWQAAFAEFGRSTWVHLADFATYAANTILEAAGVMPQGGPSFKQPEATKPKVIVVAHAMKNDAGVIEAIGFTWSDHFEVVATIDTQLLAWPFWCNNNSEDDHNQEPGLHSLMDLLNIKKIRMHHGGNDAAYTAHCLVAIVLKEIQDKGIYPVTGNPRQEVGAIVDSYRGDVYKQSTCTNGDDACNVCGSFKHCQIQCIRRCLYCMERQFHKTFHSYIQCPKRLAAEKHRRDQGLIDDAVPTLLKLQDNKKRFVMTAREARLLGVRLRPAQFAATARQRPRPRPIQHGIILTQTDPRLAEQAEAHQNGGDFEKEEDDFPGLPPAPKK